MNIKLYVINIKSEHKSYVIDFIYYNPVNPVMLSFIPHLSSVLQTMFSHATRNSASFVITEMFSLSFICLYPDTPGWL